MLHCGQGPEKLWILKLGQCSEGAIRSSQFAVHKSSGMPSRRKPMQKSSVVGAMLNWLNAPKMTWSIVRKTISTW